MNTGFGLALGSWASIVLLALAAFVVYSYRISVEERTLLAVVGSRTERSSAIDAGSFRSSSTNDG